MLVHEGDSFVGGSRHHSISLNSADGANPNIVRFRRILSSRFLRLKYVTVRAEIAGTIVAPRTRGALRKQNHWITAAMEIGTSMIMKTAFMDFPIAGLNAPAKGNQVLQRFESPVCDQSSLWMINTRSQTFSTTSSTWDEYRTVLALKRRSQKEFGQCSPKGRGGGRASASLPRLASAHHALAPKMYTLFIDRP